MSLWGPCPDAAVCRAKHFLILLSHHREVGDIITSVLEMEKSRRRKVRLLFQTLANWSPAEQRNSRVEPRLRCPPEPVHFTTTRISRCRGQAAQRLASRLGPPCADITSSPALLPLSSFSSSLLSVSFYLERLGTQVQGPQI